MNLSAISQARDELKQAQKVFKEMQDKGLIAIDAEDDSAMDAEVVMKEESSTKIRTGLQHLTKSLQELAQQAEQEHVEEQEHMKKEAEKGRNAGQGRRCTNALQPFGGAHSG